MRRDSLRWRLPVFFGALIIAMLAIFLWATYREIESTLLREGYGRARSSAEQVAGILERSVKARLDENDSLRVDPELRAYLRTPTPETREAARKDIAPSRPFRRVELWDTAGSLVLEAATPRPDSGTGPKFLPPGAPPVREGISELGASGNRNFFDVVVAVRDGPSPTAPHLGYFRRFGSITSTPGGNIKRLLGDEAIVKIGSVAGGVWTDFYSIVDTPPLGDMVDKRTDGRAADGRRWIGGLATIEGAPWVVWVGYPRAAILAPTRPFMRRMIVLGLLFVAAGMVLVVMLGIRLTQPLHALARAAEEIAAGDYTRRVTPASRDEAGQLAASFNSMAQQVADSHAKLEARVEERTRALQEALTELQAAQAELVKREKLAILGQLAGGVGHELRNPLGVMTNALYYLDAVLRDVPPEVTEYLGILRTQIGLSEKIIGDLLDFARVKPPQRAPVPLGDLVGDQLERLGPLNGVTLRSEIPESLPPACIDRVQLGQVVLNLLANAVQAMNGAGTLTLRGELEQPDRLRLDVRDTGAGIAPDDARRIFEPLFTTKARGIGLGLAVSRTLVHANGGEITFASEPGRGTTFTVRLPIANGNGACTAAS